MKNNLKSVQGFLISLSVRLLDIKCSGYCVVFSKTLRFLRDHFQDEKKEAEGPESKTKRSPIEYHSQRCFKVALSGRKCVPHQYSRDLSKVCYHCMILNGSINYLLI